MDLDDYIRIVLDAEHDDAPPMRAVHAAVVLLMDSITALGGSNDESRCAVACAVNALQWARKSVTGEGK